MEDDLEAILAADEASIKDDGFAARVTDAARERRWLRRGWLTAAGVIGATAAAVGVSVLSPEVESAVQDVAPAQLVFALPVVDLSLQVPGESLLGLALALAMGLGVLAARFASDDF